MLRTGKLRTSAEIYLSACLLLLEAVVTAIQLYSHVLPQNKIEPKGVDASKLIEP